MFSGKNCRNLSYKRRFINPKDISTHIYIKCTDHPTFQQNSSFFPHHPNNTHPGPTTVPMTTDHSFLTHSQRGQHPGPWSYPVPALPMQDLWCAWLTSRGGVVEATGAGRCALKGRKTCLNLGVKTILHLIYRNSLQWVYLHPYGIGLMTIPPKKIWEIMGV